MTKVSITGKSYRQTVTINTSKEKVFSALTSGIENWWGAVDKEGQQVGEIFKVSWGEPWYQFEIIEFQIDTKVTWKCVDANQIIGGMEGVAKEWVGTKLYWAIEVNKEDEIQVSLIHEGLAPTLLCYDVCSFHWDKFITESLKDYLEQ